MTSLTNFVDFFYSKLNLPQAAYLGARIYKKQLLENADLTITDRKWVNDDIESLEWRYTLKPATINVTKYEDADREYLEIALLHVKIKSDTHVKRLGEVIQRSIPYPLILVFECDNRININLADKRVNRADASKLKVEQFFDSDWLFSGSEIELAFLEQLNANSYSHQDLFTYYQELMRRVVALQTAKFTGKFSLTANAEADKLRQENLEALKQLELQLVSLKAQVKNETQFNRKLERNVQIKQIKQQIQQITTKLSA
jgi:hypothetical protein